jgi:hypothetical protein
MADVVFVMDESYSGASNAMFEWVRDRIFSPAPAPIEQALAAKGFTSDNVRYGLVGFAGINQGFAHSYIVNANPNPDNPDPLFGTAAQMDAAFENFNITGSGEDGWDAIEHVIAEYQFRDGAVPAVILLQNQEGRNVLNTTLTRYGVIDALESKNVVVDVLGYGSQALGGGYFPNTFAPMLNLTPYGGNQDVRILGVEADIADGVADGQHDYVGFFEVIDGALTNNAGTTTAEALQVSFNGSNTGATGMVATGKSILFSTTGSGGIGPSNFGYRARSVPFENSPVSGAGSVVLSNLVDASRLERRLCGR